VVGGWWLGASPAKLSAGFKISPQLAAAAVASKSDSGGFTIVRKI